MGDADFADMADLAATTVGWEAGVLSKEATEWVLVTEALAAGRLQGFMLSTLERIGGTPALVIGMASVARTDDRAGTVEALMAENYHKALMAFPDEDVIVAARVAGAGPYQVFAGLTDVRPWPGVRANGEERAWGRRLSKRYGAVEFDDRAMVGHSEGEIFVIDHEPTAPCAAQPPAEELVTVDPAAGTHLIAWGWAMAEFLEGFSEPRS
ncbi:MAG: hypothetical protein ACK5PP_08305 [Acidimicrobiales bacterium]